MPVSCGRRIDGLYVSEHRANCWVWVRDSGWRQLDDRNEESCTRLLRVATKAKSEGWLVSLHEEQRGDRWVITEMWDLVNGDVGPAQEISFGMAECTFNWTARFRQRGTRITVRIRLVPDSDVSATTMATLRDRWRTAIESKWSNRFGCCTSPGCVGRCALTFGVEWVDSGEHHTVRVRTGPEQTNMTLWDTADSGDVASHEFGHMIGHPDEYASTACPSRSPVGTGTVMDDNTEVVERLVRPFCDRLGQPVYTA